MLGTGHCQSLPRSFSFLFSFEIYLKIGRYRPSFPGHDLIFLSKFNSQVMWNLLFEPLIGNFKSDVKFLNWIFFLWQLISCQTLKSRPKISVWNKNQISDRKIKSCWINLIWNFTFGPYMIYFCFLWCKIILTVDFHVTEKEGLCRSQSAHNVEGKTKNLKYFRVRIFLKFWRFY